MIPGLKARVFSLHDVLMYIAIARKYLRLMVLLVCFALTVGLTYYIFARPVYHAVALVHVDNLPRPLDTDKLYNDGQLQIVSMQFAASHILERTGQALGIDTDKHDVEKDYLTKIALNFNTERDLVVEVFLPSADLANHWTETMVREFLAYRAEKRVQERDYLVKTYSAEMKEVLGRIDLQSAEKLNFQDEKGLTEALIRLRSIRSLPEDLSRMQTEIDEMGRIRVRLLDPSLDTVAKLSLIASIEDKPDAKLKLGQAVSTGTQGQAAGEPEKKDGNIVVVVPSLAQGGHTWDNILRDLQTAQARVDEALKTHLEGSAKVTKLKMDLAPIQEKLDAEYEVAQKRFDLTYQELINKKNDLEAKMPEYKEISRKYEKLLSEVSLYDISRLPFEAMFGEMKKKQEAALFAGEKERIDLRYGGLIRSADRAISPNRLKLVLLSLAIGLALAVGVPFLIEYMDHTLSNLEQVESTFRMRGLGIVPQIEASTVSSAALIGHEDDRKDSLIENFRVIRTNMLSMGALTKEPHVVMVTSAMPKEGKTVVSSNLAVSFAHTGARTLLMDTDLRRGRLHRLFGYRKDPGLSNVLMGEVTLEQACRPTGQENLEILSAGRHLDTGTELLGSPRFMDLMNSLRGRYDRIVIDTPPVLGLSETSVMQKLVDGVLFVIWTGNTPSRSVKSAIDTLAANGANFYGFVLNRLDLSTTQNYYQYYYYSHDYYYQQPLENA